MIKPREKPSGPSSDIPGNDTAPTGGADPGPNTGAVSDAIKRRLKALYDQIADEPVPEKHRRLLDELERKSREAQPGKGKPTKPR